MTRRVQSTVQQSLQPGDVLSYSAGSSALDPESFRKITQAENRLGELLRAFPNLAEDFAGGLPLVVSCYPAATLGCVSQAVFVDTYMRQANFSRAMMLGGERNMATVVIAQPLAFLEFLFRHVQEQRQLPARLIVILGGYYCPASAERAIKELVTHAGSDVTVLFGYGMAEVAVGCLIGMSRTSAGQVIYRPVMSSVEPNIDERSRLSLKIVTGERAGIAFDTGDTASRHDDGIVVDNAPRRANPALLQEFESWTASDWKRRTGFAARCNGGYVFQLRQGVHAVNNRELEFYQFAEQFAFSWLDKPDWS